MQLVAEKLTSSITIQKRNSFIGKLRFIQRSAKKLFGAHSWEIQKKSQKGQA